ncbi:hypothetical protein RJ640_009661 [Escallonia rubra]|uniref:CCHC-type domain-containing protein n=1 Tax=Escallonia rubra TaxID=112253 RepID=A0AA88QGN5_9ASTE|nr:hypothetical protein RJ640_009661 [Escallonia rubra]
MSNNTTMKYACEQFDGKTNFGIWQSTVKDILVQQGLLKPLLGNKPESMDQDDWEELQAKAVSTIRYENKNGHGRGRGRSKSRNSGHGNDRSKSRGKQDKSSIECWYCKEIGHIARRCPERKEKKNGKKHVNNANVAEEDDKSSDGDLYLVSSVEQQEGNLLSVRDNSFSTEWFLDSACSFHMCPHKEWFDCLTPCDGGTVLMGNDAVCKVMGIGTIKIKMFDGIVRTLGDVRYIPDLKKNLISLGTLDSIDCSISIKGGVMKVSKGAMVIMKGQKIGNLYKLIGNTVIGGASVSTHVGSSNDNSELWHKRLGHLSEGALHEQRTKSTDESTDGSTDEQSLEDPEEHPSDSWNLVRDREPRTKKPTQSFLSQNSSGLTLKHIKTGDNVSVSRRVVAIFLTMTMADFSDQLFGFQDNLFENSDGRLEFIGNNFDALWPGDCKPGLWMNSISRMGVIYTLIVREEEIVARDLYWEAVCQVSKRGLEGNEEMLKSCIEKNPFVGEPHVVLSQIYLSKGRFEEAEKEAEKGLRLMLEWGSPWDKRTSWEGWIAWTRVLLMKAKERSWPRNSWGFLSLGLVK